MNDELEKALEGLKLDITKLETEKQDLQTQIAEETLKTREICRQLLDKEDEVSRLHDTLILE